MRSREVGNVAIAAVTGESIWTESAHKSWLDGIGRMLERARFRLLDQWVDGDQGFALTLAAARSVRLTGAPYNAISSRLSSL